MFSVKDIVIYDLDSTLCDTLHRQHMTPFVDRSYTWEQYSMACAADGVIKGTAARMRLDYPQFEVHVVSGRNECAMELTCQWLQENVGDCVDRVVLRPDGSHMPNAEFKIKHIRTLQNAGRNVVLAYEDWPEVAKLIMARTGVPVLCVNPMYAPVTKDGAPALVPGL